MARRCPPPIGRARSATTRASPACASRCRSASVPRHYLDHASTSLLRPEAFAAMRPWFLEAADPGRVHTEGHAARVAIEIAREQVSALLGCRGSREVVFTSGATESIVTATWMATERSAHIVLPAVE